MDRSPSGMNFSTLGAAVARRGAARAAAPAARKLRRCIAGRVMTLLRGDMPPRSLGQAAPGGNPPRARRGAGPGDTSVAECPGGGYFACQMVGWAVHIGN